MSHSDNVIDIRRPVEFSMDGQTYRTTARRQPAADVLRLAGLDPHHHELGELRRNRRAPIRYAPADIVEIHRGTRFVSLTDRADAR